MSPWPAWAWLFWVSGAGTGLLAIVALYRGLWHDPRAGTRRCRGCGYDMTGIPGLICPECGRAARSERVLLRRRRSWRWSLAGLLMALLGAGSGAWPKVQRDGWWTVTPSTVLIVMWPDRVPNVGLRGKPGMQRASVADFVKWQIDKRELWSWQRSLLVSRCIVAIDRQELDPQGDLAADFAVEMLETRLLKDALPAVPAVARYVGRNRMRSVSIGRAVLRLAADAGDAELGWPLGNGDGQSRVREYWSRVTGLPSQDPSVARLAEYTRDDPFLVPPWVHADASQDPMWQPWSVASPYMELPNDEQHLRHFERTMLALDRVKRAPDISSVLMDWIKRDGSWSTRRIAYRVVLFCRGLPDGARVALENRKPLDQRDKFWIGAINRAKRGDTPALESWLLEYIKVGGDVDIADADAAAIAADAAEIAGATLLATDTMIDALEAFSSSSWAPQQVAAVEALDRLRSQNPRALEALRRIAASGPHFARMEAVAALAP